MLHARADRDNPCFVRFELRDGPGHPFWMLLRRPRAEVCSAYPGTDEDLTVTTDSATLAHWHLRHITYEQAVADDRMRIDGPPKLIKQFLASVRPSPFADHQSVAR